MHARRVLCVAIVVCVAIASMQLVAAKTAEDVYEVVFNEATAKTQAIGESEIDSVRWVPMKLENGSSYDCLLPDETASGKGEKAKPKFKPGEKLPEALTEKVHAALRQDKHGCVVKVAGWWIYELCWNKHVRQFHQNGQQVVETEYFLGKGPSYRLLDGATEELYYGESSLHGPYVSTTYYNGTECDLSGRERQVEVRVMCSKDNEEEDPFIEVSEPETCKYAVTLTSPSFCAFKELTKSAVNTLSIQCFERSSSIDNL